MTPYFRCRLRLCPAALLLLAASLASPLSAQLHDLVLRPAPDITSADPLLGHSMDIKVGADFDVALPEDLVRRGVGNPIYARFRVGGVEDFMLSSGAVMIHFHYRNAAVGETPPPISDASWTPIVPTLPVTWAAGDPIPFLGIDKIWPTNYPSVVTRSINWTPLLAGNLFHVRAEAVYPPGTTDENPDDNVAISLYESILGLRDVDVVIVHDVSGSMLTFNFAGDTYLAHAKARAQSFVASMNESHRLAVVAFGGCLAGDVSNVWSPLVPPLQPASPMNKPLAIASIIGGVTVPSTACSTPLGVGLQRAIDILTSVPLEATRKRAILLLTDGYENSGAPRACSGVDPAATAP